MEYYNQAWYYKHMTNYILRLSYYVFYAFNYIYFVPLSAGMLAVFTWNLVWFFMFWMPMEKWNFLRGISFTGNQCITGTFLVDYLQFSFIKCFLIRHHDNQLFWFHHLWFHVKMHYFNQSHGQWYQLAKITFYVVYLLKDCGYINCWHLKKAAKIHTGVASA